MSDITLLAFPSRTILKLHNIPGTPEMFKKFVTDLDTSKTSGYCVPGHLYILADLFIVWLKESCFPVCWKVLSLVPVVNPFLSTVPILYPLKTPENQRFSGVFRGYKMGTLARNGLRMLRRSLWLKTTVLLVFFMLLVRS